MAAKRSTARSGPSKTRSRKTPRSSPSPDSKPDAVEQIQRLIDVMIRTGAVEVELQDEGQKIRVRLKEERAAPVAAVPPVAAPQAAAPPPAAAGTDLAEDQDLFKSPMVGTFYRSPSPDSEPFIQVGDSVDEDTTLCIIEAMKVMNEIKAERKLRVIDVLAQNGEPVEFGQPLFLVAG